MSKEAPTEAEKAAAVALVKGFVAVLLKQYFGGKESIKVDEVYVITLQRMLDVFNWIVDQTEGFTVAVQARFYYQLPMHIGLYLGQIVHNDLQQLLSQLEQANIPAPVITDGASEAISRITISDLALKFGMPGQSIAGVRVIHIHDDDGGLSRTVVLEDIPKSHPES